LSRNGMGVPSIRQSKAKKARQKVDDGLSSLRGKVENEIRL